MLKPIPFLTRTCAARLLLGGVVVAGAAPVRGQAAPAEPAAITPAATAPATRPGAGENEQLAVEEWVRVGRFVATKSPNKWRMYENLPPDGSLKRQLRQQIVQRYRALQRLEQNDPERHDLESRAIWIEDEIYGILRNLESVTREGQDSVPVERELRAKVDELVENRDKWKAKRLQRVARELRSMSGGGGANLAQAAKTAEDEAARLLGMGADGRRQRVDHRVREYKQKMTGTQAVTPFGRPLPGGDRPPAEPAGGGGPGTNP